MQIVKSGASSRRQLRSFQRGFVFGLVALIRIAASSTTEETSQQIRKVETGLIAKVRIKGQPFPSWTISERSRHYEVPGTSIAVISNGSLSWAKGYGMAANGIAVKPDTLFQAASISKPVSAMVGLRLVELGKLSLDEDVNARLHSWKFPITEVMRGEPVTLRRIMSHTAGLTVHGFLGYRPGMALPTTPQLLDGTAPANTPPVRVDIKPGSQMRYSGGGFEVMQELVEDLTGKPFAAVADELVLKPLGMVHSTFEQPLPQRLRPLAATGHDSKGALVEDGWRIYPEQAAAGLWTTPSDLTKLILEIQKPRRVLKPSTVAVMLTPVLDHWGLGVQLSGSVEQPAFEHGGANDGFRCMLFAYLNQAQGAVVMTNGDNGTLLSDEIFSSIALAYGWPDFRPVERTVIQVSARKIAEYAGFYQAPGGFLIHVSVERGTLYIQKPAYPRSELLPFSETTFFDPDGIVPDIHFEVARDGTLQISGGGMVSRRVR